MAEGSSTESVAAWVPSLVKADEVHLILDGADVGAVMPCEEGWRWWAWLPPYTGKISGGTEPTREQAMAAAELAVRL